MISVGKPPTVPTARRVRGPLPQPLFAGVAAGDDNKDAMSSPRNNFVAGESTKAKAGRGGVVGAALGILHPRFAGRRPWSMALMLSCMIICLDASTPRPYDVGTV